MNASYALTAIAAAVLGVVTILMANDALADPEAGQRIFEARCKWCHDLPDPQQPPPEGWLEALDKMGPLARLSKSRRQDVLEFLTEHEKSAVITVSMADDRNLFEAKCTRCHTLDRVFFMPSDAKYRRHVLVRMQSRDKGWISDQELERILAYLEAGPVPVARVDSPADPSDPKEIFVQRCTACHTLERVYLKLDEADGIGASWAHIVNRMRARAPTWITEDEAANILAYLTELRAQQKPEQNDAGQP